MTSHPAHILVVDDDPEVRKVLAKVLKRFGYQVDLLPSAEETLVFLNQHTCDLILLDLYLAGGMSGLEFLRAFKNQPLPTPVLVFTGDPEVETAVEAMRLGACDYLKKSPDFKLLCQKIDLALKGRLSRGSQAQAKGRAPQLAEEVRATHQKVRRLERHLVTLEALVAADPKGTRVAPEGTGTGSVLTGREQEVVRRIAQGQKVAQIAEELCLSKKTIWELRRRALRKLGLKADAELGRYAQTQGWVQ